MYNFDTTSNKKAFSIAQFYRIIILLFYIFYKE
jgi:hypothetical protein